MRIVFFNLVDRAFADGKRDTDPRCPGSPPSVATYRKPLFPSFSAPVPFCTSFWLLTFYNPPAGSISAQLALRLVNLSFRYSVLPWRCREGGTARRHLLRSPVAGAKTKIQYGRFLAVSLWSVVAARYYPAPGVLPACLRSHQGFFQNAFHYLTFSV